MNRRGTSRRLWLCGGAVGPLAGASYLGRRRQCSNSRREQCTSLGWRSLSRRATRVGLSRSRRHSSSIPHGIPLPYLHRRRRRHQCRFREVVVSSEGDVRNALGESYVNGAWRHPRVTGVRRRQAVNTGGGRGGVTRCGRGHAWVAGADIS